MGAHADNLSVNLTLNNMNNASHITHNSYQSNISPVCNTSHSWFVANAAMKTKHEILVLYRYRLDSSIKDIKLCCRSVDWLSHDLVSNTIIHVHVCYHITLLRPLVLNNVHADPTCINISLSDPLPLSSRSEFSRFSSLRQLCTLKDHVVWHSFIDVPTYSPQVIMVIEYYHQWPCPAVEISRVQVAMKSGW